MKIGVTNFPTDKTIGPGELAQAVEERGFESLFFSEHTHIPASMVPRAAGEPVPPGLDVLRTYDLFVAFGAAAAVTTDLVLGTGICLVAQHDPIVLAKQVASLDFLSGGRLVFGIGYGWNVAEMNAHGIEFKERREIVRERMLAMESLWTDEIASFEGTYMHLPPSYAWPKPVQQPRPPVLIGGAAGPKLFAAIAEYGDGWIPTDVSALAEDLPKLKAAFGEAGRDPESVLVTLFGVDPDVGKLDLYRELGVERAVFRLPQGMSDEVLPALDELRKML
jgi:probable F420-dependent oxidoreductase